MKFKNMYACVARRSEKADDSYKPKSPKNCKESGNNKSRTKKFMPKWNALPKPHQQQQSNHDGKDKGATAETSESKQKMHDGEEACSKALASHQATSILDRTLSPVPLPSPIKSTVKSAIPPSSRFVAEQTSTSSLPQQPHFSFAKPHSQGTWQKFQPLTPSIAPPSGGGDGHTSKVKDVSPENTLRLIEQINSQKASTQQQQHAASATTTAKNSNNTANNQPASTPLEDNQFEDLKLEMMEKYGFVPATFKLPIKRTPPHQQPAASHHQQPTPLHPHHHQQQQGKERASSTFDWSEIPPIIPPREPLRNSRNPMGGGHHRHMSTPSPTTTTPPPSSSSSAAHNTRARANTSHPSTVSVFSPIPPCTSTPLIYPVMKNGKQDSCTHYYLFANNKSKEQIRREQLKNEPLCSIARPQPTSSNLVRAPARNNIISAPPRPPPPANHNLIKDTSFISSRGGGGFEPNDTATFPPRRIAASHLEGGTSAASHHHHNSASLEKIRPPAHHHQQQQATRDKYSSMGPSQKSIIIQSEVFGVTNDDCRQALKRNNGDVELTIKFLKIEQLYRLGVSSRDTCKQLLHANNWNLQLASRLIIDQHHKATSSSSANKK